MDLTESWKQTIQPQRDVSYGIEENRINFKDYLPYKTMSSEAQIKSFFLFRRKIMLRSKDIQVFEVIHDLSNLWRHDEY